MTGDDKETLSPDSHNNGMSNEGQGSVSTGDQAPNVIIDGKCKSCDTEVDLQAYGISCFSCKTWYHGMNCSIPPETNANVCPTSMFEHFTNAINKSSRYDKRIGRFLFICNHCDTENEKNENIHVNDRVDVLDKKFTSFQTSITDQLKELKSIMTTNTSSANTPVSQVSSAKVNPWDDKQRAAQLRQVVTIENKSSFGEELNRELLEKNCRDNRVRVVRSYEMPKSGKTAFVVESKSDAEKLTQSAANDMPNHKTDQISAKTPRINVVGLEKNYGKEELSELLIIKGSDLAVIRRDKHGKLNHIPEM